MRKIMTTTWVTLDGFIAGPNGEMDWLAEIYDEATGAYENELASRADTLLLGGMTYQSFAGSWPHVPDIPNASEGEKAYARKLGTPPLGGGQFGHLSHSLDSTGDSAYLPERKEALHTPDFKQRRWL